MKKSVICDIDGVILHNNDLIPGADRFVHRLLEQGTKLLFLTNYPAQTQKDLQNRFRSAGIEVPEECFYTSAMGTADFLKRQDGKKAYVIGEGALTHELYKAGFTITDIDPDFVVVGETRNYNWTMMHPACGALCAPIERMTGKKPFYVGKPSAWIIRAALNRMEAHSDDTIIIGDNLRTDILAGFQAGLETVLVLSGVSKVADIDRMPFRPNHIFDSVVDIDIV
ncbi:UMP phosphatase [Aeromonas salmonicida]|uniref:HAD hydrolase-like protein n=1 Tax=Aeromonas salmonicida TaxID=645 RepID=UPI000F767A03|nr:HAD hydrolase-like protein [Aeromonas salmonicida]RSM24852.1 UMP phosphatase [Aeromonas salmonicida]